MLYKKYTKTLFIFVYHFHCIYEKHTEVSITFLRIVLFHTKTFLVGIQFYITWELVLVDFSVLWQIRNVCIHLQGFCWSLAFMYIHFWCVYTLLSVHVYVILRKHNEHLINSYCLLCFGAIFIFEVQFQYTWWFRSNLV